MHGQAISTPKPPLLCSILMFRVHGQSPDLNWAIHLEQSAAYALILSVSGYPLSQALVYKFPHMLLLGLCYTPGF